MSAGPLLLAISSILDPAWEDTAAAYLAEVADNKGAYIAAGVIATIGTLIFIVGMLGVMRLMRRQRVTLGQVAAGLLTFGLIGLTPLLALFNAATLAKGTESIESARQEQELLEERRRLQIADHRRS